jgi:hypothetical protein
MVDRNSFIRERHSSLLAQLRDTPSPEIVQELWIGLNRTEMENLLEGFRSLAQRLRNTNNRYSQTHPNEALIYGCLIEKFLAIADAGKTDTETAQNIAVFWQRLPQDSRTSLTGLLEIMINKPAASRPASATSGQTSRFVPPDPR